MLKLLVSLPEYIQIFEEGPPELHLVYPCLALQLILETVLSFSSAVGEVKGPEARRPAGLGIVGNLVIVPQFTSRRMLDRLEINGSN